jgi:hypothetical protein
MISSDLRFAFSTVGVRFCEPNGSRSCQKPLSEDRLRDSQRDGMASPDYVGQPLYESHARRECEARALGLIVLQKEDLLPGD